ncbi:hypothetical protein [Streptomyces sp. NPDC058612]|uniref:hypothetical protein n=1 Tax=Streptomyces sp. NPDC058612 TaxID=3346555 RepID=UPI00364B3E56
MVVDRDGAYLTDEFVPAIRRYCRTGQVLGTLPVPDAFRLPRQGSGPPRTGPRPVFSVNRTELNRTRELPFTRGHACGDLAS